MCSFLSYFSFRYCNQRQGLKDASNPSENCLFFVRDLQGVGVKLEDEATKRYVDLTEDGSVCIGMFLYPVPATSRKDCFSTNSRDIIFFSFFAGRSLFHQKASNGPGLVQLVVKNSMRHDGASSLDSASHRVTEDRHRCKCEQ